jgi:acyl dehydratase
MFGERVAHGLLGLSIASGLAVRLGFLEESTIAFTGLDWKFKAPIKIGDTIRVRLTVAELRAVRRLGGGVTAFDVELLNQRDEVTQQGRWTMLVKSRPAQPASPS